MIQMRTLVLTLAIIVCLAAAAPVHSSTRDAEQKQLLTIATDLNPKVLQYAFAARASALKQGLVKQPNIFTVIDFTLPSSQKRLWTFDLSKHTLLFHELVAHGKESGDKYAANFSNDMSSTASSVGLYVTDVPYFGKNGYSLRLVGLEKGFNDNIYSRAVVFHGAWYVSEDMVKQYGRVGRSYGCTAVRQEIATPMIDVIKNGSLMFAYYPLPDWLQHSRFLHS